MFTLQCTALVNPLLSMSRNILLFILLVLPGINQAQNLLGLTTSPRSGTNRVYLNPALAADSPYRVYVNGLTANAHIDNNFVRYTAPYSMLRLLVGNVPDSYRRANGTLRFDVNYTEEINNDQVKNGTLWGEARGPAIQCKLGEAGSLVISTRLRAVAQFNGASRPFLSAIRASLSNAALFSIPNSDNSFSANANTYAEFGVTYARSLLETENGKLLAGVTAKYVVGYTAGYLLNQQLNYELNPDATTAGQAYFQVDKLVADLGYTNFLQNRSLSPRTLLNPNAPGRGVGFDVGLTYIGQPDPDGPSVRLGLALNDIGAIHYTGESYTVDQQNVRFKQADFNGVTGTEQIANVLRERLGIEPANSTGGFTTGLPTALNLSADYQLPTGWGVNLVGLFNVRSAQSIGIHQPTLVGVIPRYENKIVTVALPILYLNQTVTAGVSLRAGPIWLGSDNLLGLFGNSSTGIKPKGADIYAGLGMGF